MRAKRLTSDDRALARRLFVLMAEVFAEDYEQLGDGYLDRLLSRQDFWAIAAFTDDDDLIGGITAHTLPMTRIEASEIFIYDIAVRGDQQRKGVGRLLTFVSHTGSVTPAILKADGALHPPATLRMTARPA